MIGGQLQCQCTLGGLDPSGYEKHSAHARCSRRQQATKAMLASRRHTTWKRSVGGWRPLAQTAKSGGFL